MTVKKTTWNGWEEAVEITNKDAKVIVVPQIGRIMYYGLAGQDNMLWNNPQLAGKSFNPEDLPTPPPWNNFGGDKAWPTQQDDFVPINGYAWPPDPWFDCAQYTAELLNDGVAITSPVSKNCGAQVTRTIQLAETGSRVTIKQHLTKVKAAANADVEPIAFTIWNISQVKSPQFILFDINPKSIFEKGFYAMQPASDKSVTLYEKVGVFKPHNKRGQKIGSDSQSYIAALVDNTVIGEFIKYTADAVYPDKGCSMEIYTSPHYIEMEPLSPLKKLEIGESIDYTIAWELFTLPGNLENETDKINAISEWAESAAMK